MECAPEHEDVLLVDAQQLLRALVFLRAPFREQRATLEFSGTDLIIFDGHNRARAQATGVWAGLMACRLCDLWDVLAFDCIDMNTTTLHIGPDWIQAGEMVVAGRTTLCCDDPADDEDHG